MSNIAYSFIIVELSLSKIQSLLSAETDSRVGKPVKLAQLTSGCANGWRIFWRSIVINILRAERKLENTISGEPTYSFNSLRDDCRFRVLFSTKSDRTDWCCCRRTLSMDSRLESTPAA
jgi:hypothetical protein